MNWLDAGNPWNLAKPPAWWLQQLHTVDPQLVIFPSKQQPCYRMARRTNSAAPLVLGKLDKNPDTQILAQHRLIMVKSFVPWTQWTAEIFTFLQSRDMWAVGGADKAADILEYKELHQHMRDERTYEDERDMLSGSAYRAAKSRMGQTIFVHQ